MDGENQESCLFHRQRTVLEAKSNMTDALISSHGFSSPSELISLQVVKLRSVIQDAINSTHNRGSYLPNSFSPYQLSNSMLTSVTCLVKQMYRHPLVTTIPGIRFVSERMTELVDKLNPSLVTSDKVIKDPSQTSSSDSNVMEQLTNQLEQLGENVANLQASNDDLKSHNEILMHDIEDMKGLLELLYHQLKKEELNRLPTEKELKTKIGIKNNPDIILAKSNNPPAEIKTSMDEFHLSAHYMYQDANPAWLRPPKKDDYILFKFTQPILIKKFKIGTGHYEYPSNILVNATIEILPSSQLLGPITVITKDSYVVVGRFDDSGLAEGEINWNTVGLVQCLRINIHSNCYHWIIMSETTIESSPTNEITQPVDIEEFECW